MQLGDLCDEEECSMIFLPRRHKEQKEIKEINTNTFNHLKPLTAVVSQTRPANIYL